MPITIDAELRKLSQDEFGHIAFEVMGHAIDIHRELGRFFDEGIYQAELFLNHTDIEALHWVNLTRSRVTFRTLSRNA